MEEVIITGIGLVGIAGNSTEELWVSLTKGSPSGLQAPVEFDSGVPSSKLRRLNRYSKLAISAAVKAGEQAHYNHIDAFRIGTIFTSGYGSIVSHIKFCREVIKGEPDLCSPIAFAGIVPNCCVGNVCMVLGCKGVSTVLLGGDNVLYSKILLNKKKADVIFTGAVEEYCEELFLSLQKNPQTKGIKIQEGTVIFSLERQKGQEGYCRIEDSRMACLPAYPLIHKIEESQAVRAVETALKGLNEAAASRVNAVFPIGRETDFGRIEAERLERRWGRNKILKGIRQITGETLGSSYNMNIAAAALCLKKGEVPFGILHDGQTVKSFRTCLVTGCDAAGNYMCCILEGL